MSYLAFYFDQMSYSTICRIDELSYSTNCRVDEMVFDEMSWKLINLEYHLISKACFLFSNSTVKVHDSQAYRNMEMNR